MAALRAARDWWLTVVMGVMAVAIIILFWLLVPALGRLSDQAQAGAAGKRRQCAVLPVATKMYADAQKRHIITSRDFETFVASGSQLKCPRS